jgi:hypothetical protein
MKVAREMLYLKSRSGIVKKMPPAKDHYVIEDSGSSFE